MKKIIPFFVVVTLALCTLASSLTGCGGKDADKISIVTTIFPEYDWVKQILGDKAKNADITLLLDNGVDLHSFQPTAKDIIKTSNCDMFIYVGGHSDEWVDDVLAQATNKDMVVINLMEVIGDAVKTEEVVEGMQHEEDEDGEHTDQAHPDEEQEDEAHVNEDDEHIWLSLRNAKVICKEIAAKLCVIDPENAKNHVDNMNAYCYKLDLLDGEYKQAVENSEKNILLFCDRFPFRYLTDDYNLSYFAAFSGCSAESEASFETIVFLANKINEFQLSSVIKIEGSNNKIAKTVIENTIDKNAQVLTLDSMQTKTSKYWNAGETYLSIMTGNLQVLKQALR